MYLYKQRALTEIQSREANKIVEKHNDFLETNFHDDRKFENFLNELYWAADEKLLPQELEFKNDLKIILQLEQDFKDLLEQYEIEVDLGFRKMEMPVFVERHPLLKAKWIEIYEDLTNSMIDYSEVSLQV